MIPKSIERFIRKAEAMGKPYKSFRLTVPSWDITKPEPDFGSFNDPEEALDTGAYLSRIYGDIVVNGVTPSKVTPLIDDGEVPTIKGTFEDRAKFWGSREYVPARLMRELAKYHRDNESASHVHFTGKNDHFNLGAQIESIAFDEESEDWKVFCVANYSYSFDLEGVEVSPSNIRKLKEMLPESAELVGYNEWEVTEEIPFSVEVGAPEYMAQRIQEEAYASIAGIEAEMQKVSDFIENGFEEKDDEEDDEEDS